MAIEPEGVKAGGGVSERNRARGAEPSWPWRRRPARQAVGGRGDPVGVTGEGPPSYFGAMSSSPSGTRVLEAPALVRYPGKPDATAVVTLRRRNRRDRMAAVAKTWAISWLAAVAAVFLPVLHFVLVPALLIGGPLYALSMRDEHTTLLGAQGTCPACGAAVTLAQKRRAVPAAAFRCDGCGRALELAIDPAVLSPAADDSA